PCTVGEFERYAPEQRTRVNALPGLTGLWQGNGKNRTTFRQMIEMDDFYWRNISLSLDFKIIFGTPLAFLGPLFDSVQPLPRSCAQPTRRERFGSDPREIRGGRNKAGGKSYAGEGVG